MFHPANYEIPRGKSSLLFLNHAAMSERLSVCCVYIRVRTRLKGACYSLRCEVLNVTAIMFPFYRKRSNGKGRSVRQLCAARGRSDQCEQ